MENWLSAEGKNEDIVLSSRIRIARNLKGVAFPHRLNNEKGREVLKSIEKAFYSSADLSDKYKSVYLWEKEPVLSSTYLEKHLISPKLLVNNQKSGFILDNEEKVSIMLNEEDHIRLQCIAGSLSLDETYSLADKIDNLLEQNLEYAFDEKLGYLTACPTNIGTGLRASVMMHLPSISMNNEVNELVNALAHIGMTIRGLYGEGSKDKSNIYQISNQITLGVTEEEIINNLKIVVNQIINQENLSKEKLIKSYRYEIEDKIYRALGVLKSAVLLNLNESLRLLSYVRFGVEVGILKDVNKKTLNNLLIDIQPATLERVSNKKLSDKEINLNRAKLVREKLS